MFNSDARWDRHLPANSGEEGHSIQVGAIFKGGKIFPRWFVLKERKYLIKEITYQWDERHGAEKLYCFSVSDGNNIYQIHFNNQALHWRLDKICPLW